MHWITEQMDELELENTVVFIAFPEPFLNQKMEEWQAGKAIATTNLYQIVGYFVGFILAFIYLVTVVGRRSFQDQALHFRPVEKLYNDINLALCFLLFPLWIVLVDDVFENMAVMIIYHHVSYCYLWTYPNSNPREAYKK